MPRILVTICFVTISIVSAAGCDPKQRTDDCTRDDDCGPGQACLAGQCQAVECRLDGDCPAGQACQAYVCQELPTCRVDDDCELGEICELGNCQPGCRSDRDCDPGQHCFRQKCWLTCQDDSDCDPGRCHPVSAICVECITDSDCGTGLICQANQCLTGCRLDSDCPSGQCEKSTWTCVGQACQERDDCQLGQLCIQQTCQTGCESYRDCPAGMVCDPNLGSHGLCVASQSDGGPPDGGPDGGGDDGGASDGGPDGGGDDGGASDGGPDGGGDDGGSVEPARLRIELTWEPVGIDLDLHLLDGQAALCTSPGDCYFANKTPDWGLPGDPTDNPALIYDCIQNCTLEVIEIPDPAPGSYTIGVYEYSQTGGAAQATARVYLDGQAAPAASFNASLSAACERWIVAVIHINADGPPEFEPLGTHQVLCCSPF